MKISQLQPQNAKALNKQTSLKRKLNYIQLSDSQSRVHDFPLYIILMFMKCFTVVQEPRLRFYLNHPLIYRLMVHIEYTMLK